MVGSVCLSVCDVRESRLEFWTEDLGVGRITCSIHTVITHIKPDKKIPTASFSFPVTNMEGVWKILKMSYPMIGNSAVRKAIAIQFSMLDRARTDSHCANMGFSIPDYPPVLHRLKCPAQWCTLTDGPVLVPPSGEYGVLLHWRNSVWRRAINPATGIVVHVVGMFWVVSITSTEKAKWSNADSFMR
jgi:hypothetical protein